MIGGCSQNLNICMTYQHRMLRRASFSLLWKYVNFKLFTLIFAITKAYETHEKINMIREDDLNT